MLMAITQMVRTKLIWVSEAWLPSLRAIQDMKGLLVLGRYALGEGTRNPPARNLDARPLSCVAILGPQIQPSLDRTKRQTSNLAR